MVLELLNANSFEGAYNFVYVPHDFERLPALVNVGYFFVNFVTHDLALRARKTFDGFCKWSFVSRKVLVASWATKTQGYQACIQRYQGSPVMHQDVPFGCRPIFFENGKAIDQIPTKIDSSESPFKMHNKQQFEEAADHRIEGKVGRSCVPAHESTTLCFRNIPNNFDGRMILELLDGNGLKESYDFVYVPHDFTRLPALVNLGYFFVNFTTHGFAAEAWDKLDGFEAWKLESSKVLRASWAAKTQGLDACIHRYKNSSVLRQDMPLECKPMRFENGKPAPIDHSLNPGDERTLAPEGVLSTSTCSTDTDDPAEMAHSAMCVPDETVSPSAVRQMTTKCAAQRNESVSSRLCETPLQIVVKNTFIHFGDAVEDLPCHVSNTCMARFSVSSPSFFPALLTSGADHMKAMAPHLQKERMTQEVMA
jgi:hypothetical protein